jgi:hypothetical protein
MHLLNFIFSQSDHLNVKGSVKPGVSHMEIPMPSFTVLLMCVALRHYILYIGHPRGSFDAPEAHPLDSPEAVQFHLYFTSLGKKFKKMYLLNVGTEKSDS